MQFQFWNECVKNAWAKFGIEVWPGAGMVADRKSIVEKTDLEEEDLGGMFFFGDPLVTPLGGHQWGHQGVTNEIFLGSPMRRRGSPIILNIQNGSKSRVMDRCLEL